MIRLGFFLGFLVGGGIASLLARLKDEESAGAHGESTRMAGARGNPVVERIKQQLSEAQDAAREAQMEKEAEMRRMYDNLVHRKFEPGKQ